MIDKRKRKLLIIECDAPKLKVQGLSFSKAFLRTASLVLQGRLIHLIQTKEKKLIPTQFAEAKQKSSNYSVISVMGHSDSKGIRLGENAPYKWEAFSEWLIPFRPQKLLLMSCHGGKTEVCSILFKNLPSLKEVCGSPVFLNKPEAMTIAGVALADLLNVKTATGMFPVAQIISIFNKGFIWKMARGDEANIVRELTEKLISIMQNSIRNR